MKLAKKIKIYLTTGLIAPLFTSCNLQPVETKTEKPKPQTESLAYLAYKNRAGQAVKPEKLELPVFFGDEWAI